MKTKHLLLPVIAMLILFNNCRKPNPDGVQECVKKYQARVAEIKKDFDEAVKKCNNPGTPGNAGCIGIATRISDSLSKVALVEYQQCCKDNQ